MTAKEKAIELVDKMYSVNFKIDSHTAKKCALIAVDEIILVIDSGRYLQLITYIEQLNYWNEVKKEIEKL